MKKIFISICCLCTLLTAEDLPTLTISCGFNPPETVLIENVMKEVSKRAKVNIHYEVFPNKRSLVNANTGITDGDATRVWEINDYYPNLIRVPVPSHSIDLVVLSKKKIYVKDPSELSQYNVGVVRGMKIAVLLAEKNKPLSLLKATEHETLIKMLLADRLDLVITNEIALFSSLDKIRGHKLYMNNKPLMSRPLYMQLHKKNRAYIPPLQTALESMHKDGTYKRIRDDFFRLYENEIDTTLMILNSEGKSESITTRP